MGGVCGVLQAERGVSGVLKMEQRPTSGSEAPVNLYQSCPRTWFHNRNAAEARNNPLLFDD
jgi:hypothetical protein